MYEHVYTPIMDGASPSFGRVRFIRVGVLENSSAAQQCSNSSGVKRLQQ
jgi:hypothetical protein